MEKPTLMSSAGRVRNRVAHSQNRFFTVDDFDGSRSALAPALSRLEDDGELVRVKRGLYWRGAKTPLGMAPPSSAAILRAVYGDAAGVGPAGLDAARKLGLTTQITRTPTFAVPYAVEGLSLLFVNRARRTGRAKHRLDEAEIALFEVLDNWEHVVELPSTEAVKRLQSLIGTAIRPKTVAAASVTEPARVRERLHALLIFSGHKKDALQILRAANATTREEALKNFPEHAAIA